jgi:multiple sugar transport system ATP-binding protein
MAFGLQQRRIPRKEVDQRVREIARLLELEAFLDRKPRALSGGQRQRVAMGRAIVRRPSVFLMDEPLSNLDAKLRVQMRAEIRTLQRKLEVTTVYVTHDQIEAMTMGDRVAVMRRGVLQQVAPPHELYHRPTNIFVAGFIGSPAMNLLEASIDGVKIKFGDVAFDAPRLGAIGPDQARVAVGVRPEDVRIGGEEGLRARVLYVEDLGAEIIAHLESDAVPVVTDEVREIVADVDDSSLLHLSNEAQPGRVRIVTRLPAETRIRVGDNVRLTFDPAKLHLFNLQTGDRVNAAHIEPAARPVNPLASAVRT